MITLSAYKGRNVGVFGLGKAGEATVAALLAGGAHVYAWDDSESGRDALRKLYGKKVNIIPVAQWPWGGGAERRLASDASAACVAPSGEAAERKSTRLACLILSPGVPLTHPNPHPVVHLARKANCPVIGDVELLYQAQPDATYIGITGTNGKSTTTTLIAHILRAAGKRVEVGGNLGQAALSLAPLGAEGIYVIETSSYQLDLLATARFNVALLLNVTPDHLDRHGDMEGYVNAKLHLFERQQPGDAAIIAIDDDYTRGVAENMPHIPVSASQELVEGYYVKDGILHEDFDGFSLQADISNIPTLTGRHNWQNAAAACAACRAVGVPFEQVVAAMRSFPGLAHRLELIATIGGVRFINDSKATNADATSNALAPFEHIYWIAGGKAKAGGIETLGAYFPKIAHAFLIGDAEEDFAKTLEGKVKYTRCKTLDAAVHAAAALAAKEAKKEAVVLLSPACASFDQYKNFEQRGEHFRQLVGRLSSVVGRNTTDDQQPTTNSLRNAS